MDSNTLSHQMETVSVVIVGLNRRTQLLQSLKSVFDSSYTNLQVIYVDNGSTDGTIEAIKGNDDMQKRVRIISSKINSVIRARNLGFSESKGSIVLFLDDDAVLSRDTIESAVRNFHDPEIGIVGVRLVDREDKTSITTAGSDLSLPLFIPLEGLRTRRRNFEKQSFIFVACEACMFVRASLFTWLKGFDENLYPYGEEGLDLCWRAWQKGMKVLYDPILAFHGSVKRGLQDRPIEVKAALTSSLISNALLVFAKNGDWFTLLSFPFMFLRYVAVCSHRGFWHVPIQGFIGFLKKVSVVGNRKGKDPRLRSNHQLKKWISELNNRVTT